MDEHMVLKELKNLNFCAIDVETANEKRESICSIGIVIVRNGKIDHEISYLVRPKELRCSTINQQIHKLSEADLISQPSLNLIWEKIVPYFDQQILIAHNAIFDIDALQKSLEVYNLRLPSFKYLCSLKLAQMVFKDLTNFRLPNVANYLGLELNHHNALSDAKISAEIGLRTIPLINHSELNFRQEELTSDIYKIASEVSTDPWDNLFGNKKIHKDLLKPNLNVENKENVFFNQKVVFTGDLSIERKVAAELIQKMGADINTAISKLTNIVIVGQNAGAAKLEKVEELVSKGYKIKIIYEQEFLSLIA